MSNGIASAGWPNNMSAEDRKVWLHEQIKKWVGEKRTEECLSALELGNLSMTEKAVAFRTVLIVGSIKHCRAHKSAEVRMAIFMLITYLSDNAKGTCIVSIARMAELFGRSRQCIVDNILALEKDGLIGVARVDGMPNRYWPCIPAALKDMSPNPAWVIDALTKAPKTRIFSNVEEAIAAATQQDGNQSSTVDQSSGVDRYPSSRLDPHQSSIAGEPVKPEADSISSLYLTPSQRERGRCNPAGGAGDFMISSERGIFVPAATITQWRDRFPFLKDLDANMQRLASVILKKGITHPGWDNPAGWLVGALAQDNQKAADAARRLDAELAVIQRGQSMKTFQR